MAAPLLRISVESSDALKATILALKGMPAELSKQTRAAVKEIAQPEWQAALGAQAQTNVEVAVLVKTARVAVSNQNVTLKSATIGKTLPGGAKPFEIAKAVEFGAPQGTTKSYESVSRKGVRFLVHKRHTERQFEGPSRTGYVVYNAAAKIIPRIAALYVQTTVRTLHEAFEKGATE